MNLSKSMYIYKRHVVTTSVYFYGQKKQKNSGKNTDPTDLIYFFNRIPNQR